LEYKLAAEMVHDLAEELVHSLGAMKAVLWVSSTVKKLAAN
jgi:hypothetical protein